MATSTEAQLTAAAKRAYALFAAAGSHSLPEVAENAALGVGAWAVRERIPRSALGPWLQSAYGEVWVKGAFHARGALVPGLDAKAVLAALYRGYDSAARRADRAAARGNPRERSAAQHAYRAKHRALRAQGASSRNEYAWIHTEAAGRPEAYSADEWLRLAARSRRLFQAEGPKGRPGMRAQAAADVSHRLIKSRTAPHPSLPNPGPPRHALTSPERYGLQPVRVFYGQVRPYHATVLISGAMVQPRGERKPCWFVGVDGDGRPLLAATKAAYKVALAKLDRARHHHADGGASARVPAARTRPRTRRNGWQPDGSQHPAPRHPSQVYLYSYSGKPIQRGRDVMVGGTQEDPEVEWQSHHDFVNRPGHKVGDEFELKPQFSYGPRTVFRVTAPGRADAIGQRQRRYGWDTEGKHGDTTTIYGKAKPNPKKKGK